VAGPTINAVTCGGARTGAPQPKTTWYNWSAHPLWRTARARISSPTKGKPNVMEKTDLGLPGCSCLSNIHSMAKEAIAPPMDWPVNTTILPLSYSRRVCNNNEIRNEEDDNSWVMTCVCLSIMRSMCNYALNFTLHWVHRQLVRFNEKTFDVHLEIQSSNILSTSNFTHIIKWPSFSNNELGEIQPCISDLWKCLKKN